MNIFRKTIFFSDEANCWLLFKKATIKSSTYYRYKYIIEKYILPFFKSKSIYDFINYDFSDYIEHLTTFLTTKTIKDVIMVFKSALKYIKRKYGIDYKLDLISIPKYEKNEIQILKESEKNRLENYCLESNNLKYLGILICLNTGLRLGEICALKWNNINLKEKLISVNKTIQRVYKGKMNTSIEIASPKTKKSIRKIPISKKLYEQLNKLKKENHYTGEEYFLTGSNEKFIDPRTYQRVFKKCLDNCNINDYNFHILRHTFASNCISIGMDIKSLSEILGHSDVKMTLNLYVHSSYNIQKKFLDKL